MPHEKSVQSRPRCSTSNLASSAAGTREAAPAAAEDDEDEDEDEEAAVAEVAAPESFCACRPPRLRAGSFEAADAAALEAPDLSSSPPSAGAGSGEPDGKIWANRYESNPAGECECEDAPESDMDVSDAEDGGSRLISKRAPF